MWNSFYVLILVSMGLMSFMFFSFTSFLVVLLMVFFCLFFLKNQHLTISLIQLEVLGLSSLLVVSGSIMALEKEMISMFMIMVVVVIEASLGLSLIVKQARNLNKEFFKFFFLGSASLENNHSFSEDFMIGNYM